MQLRRGVPLDPEAMRLEFSSQAFFQLKMAPPRYISSRSLPSLLEHARVADVPGYACQRLRANTANGPGLGRELLTCCPRILTRCAIPVRPTAPRIRSSLVLGNRVLPRALSASDGLPTGKCFPTCFPHLSKSRLSA